MFLMWVILTTGFFFSPVQAENEWSKFTSLEEEVLSKMIEINMGCSPCSEFNLFQENRISNYVREMIQSFDLGNEKQLRHLSEALKADSRLAIDLTLAFIDNSGAINTKTGRIFTIWKKATSRLFKIIVELQPSVNSSKLRSVLEMRNGELFYYARSLGDYLANRTEKNYSLVEFHANLAFEYAQELDELMNFTSSEKAGEGIGYLEGCSQDASPYILNEIMVPVIEVNGWEEN